MEQKIKFYFEDGAVEFFVLEQTKLNGSNYLLVTDSKDEDAECLIMRESLSDEEESVYEIVEDDTELAALSKVFEELLDDVDIEF